jgi:hypothetical protein
MLKHDKQKWGLNEAKSLLKPGVSVMHPDIQKMVILVIFAYINFLFFVWNDVDYPT